MYNKNLLLLFIFSLINIAAIATPPTADSIMKVHEQTERFYVGNSFDAGIFSSANIQNTYPGTAGHNPYTTNTTGTLRFTYFINYGLSFNLNLNRHFGIFTGIDLKNVGFIEKIEGVTIKRRTYNLGAPLGIKIGNLKRKGNYLFLGAGLDVPVNYKEKEFVERSHKTKFNEWFSDRTPRVMPYLFIGAKIKSGFTFKFQYYPNNFLNPDYTDSSGYQPYAGYNVHLMLFSIGYDMHFSKHTNETKATDSKISTNSL